MKIRIILTSVAALISLQGVCEPIVDQNAFQAARNQSEIDKTRDETGCYMECRFDPAFEEHFHTIMKGCFRRLEEPQVEPFETILSLSDGGAVTQSWLDVSTNLSTCALEEIVELQFPVPPFEPYYARITVNLQ